MPMIAIYNAAFLGLNYVCYYVLLGNRLTIQGEYISNSGEPFAHFEVIIINWGEGGTSFHTFQIDVSICLYGSLDVDQYTWLN